MHICQVIIQSFETEISSLKIDDIYKTELDSHANMAVVGKHCTIVHDTGKTVSVRAFSPDCKTLEEVPIIHAMIKWQSPFEEEHFLLFIKNALHVPSMNNNLIPPFLIGEGGVVVNDVAKIHLNQPTKKDHSLYFPENDVHIPLSLNGIFSYFPSSKPTSQEVEECENILMLTPEGPWDPHSDVFSKNEENMLDFEGNMVEEKDRRILLSNIPEDISMIKTEQISSKEPDAIDSSFSEVDTATT